MNLKSGPVLCPKPFKTGSRWTSFLLRSTRLLPNLNLGKIHSRKSSPSSPFHKFRACGQHFLQCPLSNQTKSNPTLSRQLLRGIIPLIPGTSMQSFSSTKISISYKIQSSNPIDHHHHHYSFLVQSILPQQLNYQANMAATFASPSAVVGLGSGSLSSPSRISSPKKICLSSGAC